MTVPDAACICVTQWNAQTHDGHCCVAGPGVTPTCHAPDVETAARERWWEGCRRCHWYPKGGVTAAQHYDHHAEHHPQELLAILDRSERRP